MHFQYATASQIIFGSGSCAEAPALAATLGQRVFLVTDSRERSAQLLAGLLALDLFVELFLVNNEPDVNCVLMATRIAKKNDCQLIIGLGGGATLDTGKATAAFMSNPGEPIEFLEVVGSGRKLENPSLPYIAIPTTAGTGSEVTRNAVITIPEKRLKASLRSPFLLPKIAIVDPELSHSLPPPITASTGMDALTQLIEPFVCNSPSPLTDAICRDGLARIARSLRIAYDNGSDSAAREDMALASLFGGIALANARLGGVHGMANPIGGMYHVPHGVVCARLLPFVMEINLRALRKRQPNSPFIARYVEIAQLLTENTNASANDGVTWVQDLCRAFNIRPLSEYGLETKNFPALVKQSQAASSMKGNPVALTDTELSEILSKAA